MAEKVEIKDQIYTEYLTKITGYIRSKISNSHDVEDLVSCVFLKIYQKLNCFDDTKASLSTWIYTITRNTVTDYFRTRKIYCEYSDDIFCETEIDTELLTNETLEELAAALENLNERERDLIILHYYSGHTLKQIAELMTMSYANVKIIHSKALKDLKQYMTDVNMHTA